MIRQPEIHSEGIHCEEEQKNGDSTSQESMKGPKQDNKYKSMLRPRKITNYKERFNISCTSHSDEDSAMENKYSYSYGSCVLPNNIHSLKTIIDKCNTEILVLEKQFYEQEYLDSSKYSVLISIVHIPISPYPNDCIAINADVLSFDFIKFAKKQKKLTGQLFDVVLMDPPWQLSSSNPTRGVAIAYDTLSDVQIQKMPINVLQENGFIFIWTINAKYSLCFSLMELWGYKFCDEVCWIKQSVSGKIAKGHGFYLQHSKETCLVGVKGNPWRYEEGILEDCIFSRRRGQSQKPEEIYNLIEGLAPNG